MRKILGVFAFAAVASVVVLVFTTHTNEARTPAPVAVNEAVVWRDTLTGCQYVGGSSRGFHPRMNKEGKQVCE